MDIAARRANATRSPSYELSSGQSIEEGAVAPPRNIRNAGIFIWTFYLGSSMTVFAGAISPSLRDNDAKRSYSLSRTSLPNLPPHIGGCSSKLPFSTDQRPTYVLRSTAVSNTHHFGLIPQQMTRQARPAIPGGDLSSTPLEPSPRSLGLAYLNTFAPIR